ncbi:putative uncharacterized protein DDB_G0271606 [Procambarus clarkii]|uniref:putative uncharacterized protein DDB_G0271606 n=1 Tax=Procambarus clarkii TaxID=6728 RepID=UPI003743C1C4
MNTLLLVGRVSSQSPTPAPTSVATPAGTGAGTPVTVALWVDSQGARGQGGTLGKGFSLPVSTSINKRQTEGHQRPLNPQFSGPNQIRHGGFNSFHVDRVRSSVSNPFLNKPVQIRNGGSTRFHQTGFSGQSLQKSESNGAQSQLFNRVLSNQPTFRRQFFNFPSSGQVVRAHPLQGHNGQSSHIILNGDPRSLFLTERNAVSPATNRISVRRGVVQEIHHQPSLGGQNSGQTVSFIPQNTFQSQTGSQNSQNFFQRPQGQAQRQFIPQQSLRGQLFFQQTPKSLLQQTQDPSLTTLQVTTPNTSGLLPQRPQIGSPVRVTTQQLLGSFSPQVTNAFRHPQLIQNPQSPQDRLRDLSSQRTQAEILIRQNLSQQPQGLFQQQPQQQFQQPQGLVSQQPQQQSQQPQQQSQQPQGLVSQQPQQQSQQPQQQFQQPQGLVSQQPQQQSQQPQQQFQQPQGLVSQQPQQQSQQPQQLSSQQLSSQQLSSQQPQQQSQQPQQQFSQQLSSQQPQQQSQQPQQLSSQQLSSQQPQQQSQQPQQQFSQQLSSQQSQQQSQQPQQLSQQLSSQQSRQQSQQPQQLSQQPQHAAPEQGHILQAAHLGRPQTLQRQPTPLPAHQPSPQHPVSTVTLARPGSLSGFGVPLPAAPRVPSTSGTQQSSFGGPQPSAPQVLSFSGASSHTRQPGFGVPLPVAHRVSSTSRAVSQTQQSSFGGPQPSAPQVLSFSGASSHTRQPGFGVPLPSAPQVSLSSSALRHTQQSGFRGLQSLKTQTQQFGFAETKPQQTGTGVFLHQTRSQSLIPSQGRNQFGGFSFITDNSNEHFDASLEIPFGVASGLAGTSGRLSAGGPGSGHRTAPGRIRIIHDNTQEDLTKEDNSREFFLRSGRPALGDLTQHRGQDTSSFSSRTGRGIGVSVSLEDLTLEDLTLEDLTLEDLTVEDHTSELFDD